jgi:hypothetical protein
MSKLEERLEAGLAPAWRPDKEDPSVLIGKVVSIEQGTSEYEPYPLIVVEQDDGTEMAVHGFHTVLKNELIKQRPQIGERIGIKYLGEVPTKPGSKFKSYTGYRVKVERAAGAEFDWSKVGVVEPDPEPAAPVFEPVNVPPGAGTDDIPF